MANLPITVVVNLLAMINPAINVMKEKHYVKRNTAVMNGIGLIATGISLIIFHPSLILLKLPLAAFPVVQGGLGIGLTSNRNKFGTILCSSLASLIMLIIVLLVQFGLLAL